MKEDFTTSRMSVVDTSYAEVLHVSDDAEVGTAKAEKTFSFNDSLSVGNNFVSSRGNTSITSEKEVTIGKLQLLPSQIATSGDGEIKSLYQTQVFSVQTNFIGTLAPETAWADAFTSANVNAGGVEGVSLTGDELLTRVMYLNSSLVSNGSVYAKIFAVSDEDSIEDQEIFKEKSIGKTWGNIAIVYAEKYNTIGGKIDMC